jgi:HlyD family secretion protein
MKRKRIITIVVVVVLVAAVAGAGVLYTQGYFGKSTAASTTTYTIDKLTTGDLEKSVTGTGTLSAGGTTTETIPVDLQIGTVAVKTGQTVKAGDTIATIDADSLADTVASIQSDISTIDTSLARLTSSEASVTKLTSTVSGRVKQILCSVGGDVEKTMLKSNGLFVLSTDSKMKIEFKLATANSISVGTTVKVTTGSKTYKGLVELLAADGKSCTVTLTDNGTKINAEAVVYTTSGTELGSGKLAINRPYLVPATSGTISKIYVSLNSKVSSRTSLAYLTGIPTSDSYDTLVKSRAEKVALLKTAMALQKDCKLTATQDGTVQSLAISDNQDVKKGDSLATMLTVSTIKLNVSVDELDINSVSVGQAASISIDAVTGKTFDGKVESISQIGTTNNSVTTFQVTILLNSDTSLKIGMNATATIVIEKHSGVLLLPIEALQSLQGKEYVWLYTGTLPTDSSTDPGTKTVVTTGLSNDTYVEIASGLTANDQVVVVRTKSTTGTTNSNSNSMFGGMGGDMSGGGSPPSGGGQSGGQGGPPSGGGN